MKPSGPSLWRALTTSAEVADAVEYCDLSTEALGEQGTEEDQMSGSDRWGWLIFTVTLTLPVGLS